MLNLRLCGLISDNVNPKSVDFLPFPSLPKTLWKASNGGLGCNSIFKLTNLEGLYMLVKLVNLLNLTR